MNGLINLRLLPLPTDAPAGQRDILIRHLTSIVEECHREFSTLEAVILYGGYGRGEGSWIDDRGDWKPYNDYDVVVIVRKKVGAANVTKLRIRLAKKLGIRWVDLSQKTPAQIKWLRPSIYNYDLKNASSTIYGYRNFSESIPFIASSELPLKEILTLFFTRLWPFMGALGQDGFNKEFSGESVRFFRNQMAKATLAVVDVILLLEGGYDASYRERVSRVCENPLVSSDEVHLFRWALAEKLLPKAPSMSSAEVMKLYDQVHRLFSKEMYRGLSAYFGREIVTPYDMEKAYRWNIKTIAFRVIYPLMKQSFKFERVMLTNIAQIYLFGAYKGNGQIDNKLLRRANYFLSQVDSSLGQHMTWSDACITVANIRNNL